MGKISNQVEYYIYSWNRPTRFFCLIIEMAHLLKTTHKKYMEKQDLQWTGKDGYNFFIYLNSSVRDVQRKF